MTMAPLDSPPRAVIFDLDGTLLDSEPIYTQAAQAVVGPYGKVYDWSVKRLVMGGDPKRGAQIVVEQLQLPMTPEQYLAEREHHMRELCRSVPVKPGAPELIETLRERGIPMAIGTSSQRELALIKLQAHAFYASIAHTVCSDDADIEGGKPSPDIFLKAASLLDIAPHHCLVIEDTPTGVQGARNAGMRVIAVVDAAMGDADFSQATRVIHSLEAITLHALSLTSDS